MDKEMLEGFKSFTDGLADNKRYMMAMEDAKPKIEAKENNLFLIDIRSETAYRAGHIPNSVSFPLTELIDRIESIPKNRPIFVVCQWDAMSAYATMILTILGYSATLVMGGVPAWEKAGGVIEKL